MKIKTDFTTNSSSSSFVLAIKKDTKLQEIEDSISDNELEGFIEMYEKYLDELSENLPKDTSMDNKIIFAKHSIAASFQRMVQQGMELSEWLIVGGESSSEDGDLTHSFLYNCSNIDSPVLKIRGFN